MFCKGTEVLTGGSCSAWDFAPKAPAQDKVSHRQLLALTEVVLTREVALAARDNIKPQPQYCKASSFPSRSSSRASLFSTITVLHWVCARPWIQARTQVDMGPQYCQLFVYFSPSLEAHLNLEVQLVLTYITDHKNAHQVLCNCGVMQEKEEMPWDVKRQSLIRRKPLKKNRNKIRFTPFRRPLCSCGQNSQQNIMAFLQPSLLFQN